MNSTPRMPAWIIRFTAFPPPPPTPTTLIRAGVTTSSPIVMAGAALASSSNRIISSSRSLQMADAGGNIRPSEFFSFEKRPPESFSRAFGTAARPRADEEQPRRAGPLRAR